MAWFGLVLLGLIGVGLVFTGLPAFVVLIVVSIVGAGAGMLAPSVPIDLLNALPGRLIGLFENDVGMNPAKFRLADALDIGDAQFAKPVFVARAGPAPWGETNS